MNLDLLSPQANLAMMQATQGSSSLHNDIKAARYIRDMDKIEEAAQEFEAVFVSEMLKPMFEGIKTDGMFGGGKGEEVFRGFMLQEYGKMLSKTGSIGIADHVKQEMIRLQEAQHNG